MTGVLHAVPDTLLRPGARRRTSDARIALLGLGRVGAAVADILGRESLPGLERARVAAALVRRPRVSASAAFPLVTDGDALFRENPDVVIEALGGTEPARTLVLEALGRGIRVVTANKALLAAHADELFAAASRANVPLRYEASVIAGVPFLGTFSGRPLAARIDAVTGILNGTSNYILSRVDEGVPAADALSDAVARGYAEPDASKDLDGSDAAEKLAILIRCFARRSVRPDDIPRTGIDRVGPDDLARARDLGGRLKPLAHASWNAGDVSCFVGPAFLPGADSLAAVGGVLNGIRIERQSGGPLQFTGPGAGPEITARTVLDDVIEVLRDEGARETETVTRGRVHFPAAPGWFVTLRGTTLPHAEDVSDLLSAHGIWLRRWGGARTEHDGRAQSVLTFPCSAQHLGTALRAVADASGCSTSAYPIVEAARG